MSFTSSRRALIAVVSALTVACGSVHATPMASATETFAGISGHAPNGTYGFDANPDTSVAPLWEDEYIAQSGDGYSCYRIPALNTAPDGTLLASYDGRPNNCNDAPNPNSIVQRRSEDSGKTWSPLTHIATGVTGNEPVGFSDPSYIIDRETGEIFNFHVKSFRNGLVRSHAGTEHNDRNVIHAAYAKSKDGGVTWKYDYVITRQITPDPSWRARFATSGNGIQLNYGPHKGRLIQPAMILTSNNQWRTVAWISDNHGEDWYASKPWGQGMDENKIVELSNGVLMNNSRSSNRSETARKISYSYDGGVSWTEPELDPRLPDPRNNASIIRAYPNAPEGSALAKVLLFSNSSNPATRNKGTIRMSCDDGQTWPIAKEFRAGSTEYTNLTTLKDGNIGMLYEINRSGGYDIRFARFNMAWFGASCLSLENAKTRVAAGTSVTLPVTLTNSTVRPIFQQAVEFGLPTDWTATTDPAQISLAPGESTVVNVTLNAPIDGINGVNTIYLAVPDGRLYSLGAIEAELYDAQSSVPPLGTYWDETVTTPTAFIGIKNPKKNNEWHVGDRIQYEVTIVNPTGHNISVTPAGSDMQGFAPPGPPSCRWSVFRNRIDVCRTATHTITAEDLARGFHETTATWTFQDATTRATTTQEMTTPRVTVVGDPSNLAPAVVPEIVTATIDPIGTVPSGETTTTVPVSIKVASSNQTIPDTATVAVYLDGELVEDAAISNGEVSLNVTVPAVQAGNDPVKHKLVARPFVRNDGYLSVDGFGEFTVTPREHLDGTTVLTLGKLADTFAGSVEDNAIVVTARLQRDGQPVAGETINFVTSDGKTVTGITNDQGIATASIPVAPLGQILQDDVQFTVSAHLASTGPTTVVFDDSEAAQSFTVRPHTEQPKTTPEDPANPPKVITVEVPGETKIVEVPTTIMVPGETKIVEVEKIIQIPTANNNDVLNKVLIALVTAVSVIGGVLAALNMHLFNSLKALGGMKR